MEDVWDSSVLHRGSDATTLSGYSYFNPKHNHLLYLGGRCSPKGSAPPFSPISDGLRGREPGVQQTMENGLRALFHKSYETKQSMRFLRIVNILGSSHD